jgi:hypothetical protein
MAEDQSHRLLTSASVLFGGLEQPRTVKHPDISRLATDPDLSTYATFHVYPTPELVMIGSVLLLAVILGLHGCAFFLVADTTVNGTSSSSGLFGFMVYSADGERPFTSDPALLRMAAVQLLSAPLQAFFVAALAWYVKASIDEAGRPPPKRASFLTISVWLFTFLLGAYSALATIVTDTFLPYLVHYFHSVVALVVISVCFMGLDQIVAFCRQLAKDKRDIAASPAREKARFWFDIMIKTSTFDKPKHDASFSFYERHTPADILLDTARLYTGMMKVLLFICFFTYLVASRRARLEPAHSLAAPPPFLLTLPLAPY